MHNKYIFCLKKISYKKFLSSSWDNNIFLWHKSLENPIFKFQGHISKIDKGLEILDDSRFISLGDDK